MLLKIAMSESLTPERVQQLRTAVKEKYSTVSREPKGQFPYPVGRESLALLGYAPEWLHDVPAGVADHFVGVGNPFQIRPVHRGERVLDVGCGCGLDTFVADSMVGPEGRAVGVDLCPEMLKRPRAALAQTMHKHVEFSEGVSEALPFQEPLSMSFSPTAP